MQNFDVYLVLMTAALAVYYGLVKPSMEKDRKVSGEGQEAKGNREIGSRQAGNRGIGGKEIRVVIDNPQTEITIELQKPV